MEADKLIRWHRLVFGCTALIFAGIIYSWSIIKAPFESYWDSTQLGLNYTLTISFFCIGSLASGFIAKKCSSTIRLLASAILAFTGFFVVSRLDGGSILPLYIAYGVLAGLGIGVAFITVIATTNAWFPDRQGLSSGILLTAFGLSAFIFGRVADVMGRSEAIGWQNTFMIIAISLGAVLLVAALLIKPPPAGTVFPAPKGPGKKSPSTTEETTAGAILRRPLFYLTFISTAIIVSSGIVAFSFARNIVLDLGSSASFAVTSAGILAAANGLGRLVSGWLFDNIGLRKTQVVYGATGFLAPLTVVIALMTGSLFLGVVGVSLCGFTYGSTSTTTSVLAANYFGPKYYSLNLAMMNMILLPASFTSTLAGRIKDMTGEFLAAFVILASLTAFGSVLMFFLKSRKN